ncbi:MAG TPA: hypothetical protein DD377_01325 [Firmicutes bacterium]|nr:hypothetical protein [Bacillota bacterium]
MKNKTNINRLWKFYDDANNISGIVVGNDTEEARMNASAYIRVFFDDITKNEPDVYVWKIEDDDDYHCDYAIATNY